MVRIAGAGQITTGRLGRYDLVHPTGPVGQGLRASRFGAMRITAAWITPAAGLPGQPVIQAPVTGDMLSMTERNSQLHANYLDGVAVPTLAEHFAISHQRVYQILRDK